MTASILCTLLYFGTFFEYYLWSVDFATLTVQNQLTNVGFHKHKIILLSVLSVRDDYDFCLMNDGTRRGGEVWVKKGLVKDDSLLYGMYLLSWWRYFFLFKAFLHFEKSSLPKNISTYHDDHDHSLYVETPCDAVKSPLVFIP